MKAQGLYIGLMCLLAVPSLAQNKDLSVSTDKQEILLGEQINLTIQLRSGAADTVVFPQISDTLIKQIEVISRTKIDTTYEGAQLENKLLQQSFVITSFDSGYFPVAPLAALVNGDTVFSNAFLVAVQTVPIDTSKGLNDIKDIEQVPFAWKEWFKANWHWIVLAIAALALITWLALYFSKEKPAKVLAPTPVPSIPPHVTALQRLTELHEKQLWQNDKTKEYYSELTDILRTYLEERFTIPALELTTDETITSLRHHPDIDDAATSEIKRLLFLADMVKFAKEKPIGQENDMHLLRTRAFVEASIPLISKNAETNG